MTKIIAYISLAVVLALSGSLFYMDRALKNAQEQAATARTEADAYRGSLESLERLREAEIKSAESARKVLEARAREADKARDKARKENHELKEALKANPGWADEPIPDDVKRVLNQGS